MVCSWWMYKGLSQPTQFVACSGKKNIIILSWIMQHNPPRPPELLMWLELLKMMAWTTKGTELLWTRSSLSPNNFVAHISRALNNNTEPRELSIVLDSCHPSYHLYQHPFISSLSETPTSTACPHPSPSRLQYSYLWQNQLLVKIQL